MAAVNEKEVEIPLNAEERASGKDISSVSEATGDGDLENLSQNFEVARGQWGNQLEFVLTCVSYAGNKCYFSIETLFDAENLRKHLR